MALANQRTVVLGTAYGYDVTNVWVFVESLRKYYAGDVVLLVSSASPRSLFDYLLSRRISPVFFDCAAWMVSELQFSRLIRYGELLRGAPQFDGVLMTDVGDVVFQANPFQAAPAGELLVFMEGYGRTVGSCPTNSNWVRTMFGSDTLARISGQEISCQGVIMGTHEATLDYLDRAIASVKPQQFLATAGTRGHEQGVHNVLLHTGALPRAQRVPNGRHVLTCSYTPDSEIVVAEKGIVFAPTGEAPPIVHQYNYKPAFKAWVEKQYPRL